MNSMLKKNDRDALNVNEDEEDGIPYFSFILFGLLGIRCLVLRDKRFLW